MKIEILYFEGCPHAPEAEALVLEVVDELEVDAEVSKIDVETDQQARDLEFRGSPSIRIDGKDIQPDVEDHTTVGRGCRVYSTSDGTQGVPPKQMLVDALRRHAESHQ